jgi:hypothetical protein
MNAIAMNKRSTLLDCRLRWVAALIGLMCVLAGISFAQQSSAPTPEVEISGTYSYLRANAADSGGGFNLNGGSGSAAYILKRHFSIVADFGAYRFSGLPSGLESTMYTYLFGPRYSFRKVGHFDPFAQLLLGGGRLNASTSGVSAGENGFALAVGGGLDAPLRHHFAIRIVQAEYLLTKFSRTSGTSATQNSARISAGITFRFGI